MSPLGPTKAEEVKNAVTLCRWASAAYGVPAPTVKDIATLNKKAKALFTSVEGSDWQTIVQVVKWCHQRKRRYGRIWAYVEQYRNAWADGAIEFHGDTTLEDRIAEALQVEMNPAWRARLLRAAGDTREGVLKEWESHQ